MAAAIGFKRLGLAIGAAVAIGLGAVAFSSFLISADAAREAVKAQIRAVTGLDPVVRGPVVISLFPPDTVSLVDVVLGDERTSKPALSAEVLTARLRLLPLLIGRIDIADISLVRPHIALTLQPGSGQSNWAALIERLAGALKPGAGRTSLSFSEIHINDGTIVIDDADRKVSETLHDVELSLAWPSISNTFAATGQFVWRDERIETSIAIGDFYLALVGEPSGLKFRLSGAPLKIAFDGTMSNRPTLKIDGTLAADADSLRETLRWIGHKPPADGGFGRFALKAHTNAVGGTIALSGVNIELDGNAAEGVLTYASVGRQTLQGTLAAEGLDLTPYLSAFHFMAASAREWNQVPIALDGLAGADLDLRLSAARVTIGHAQFGRTAIVANLRGGRLAVTVGESQGFGGRITGSLVIAKSEAGADFKSQMQFADVDLETCLGQLFGLRRIAGKGDVAFAIDGSGNNIDTMTRMLGGTAMLTAADGALTGLNVELLLRRLERRPLSGTGDFRTGRTPYDKLNVALKIFNGIATVEDIRLDGGAVRLALGGSVSIPAREVDLRGSASLLAGANKTAGFELPFVVQGPWDDPIILPDPQSLIRRSGAAAPLLDAMRDRKTLDAARSAIDRLTGATPARPGPRPAPAVTEPRGD